MKRRDMCSPEGIHGPDDRILKICPTEHAVRDIWDALRCVLKSQREAPPIRPVSRQVDPPLSFAQQELWSLWQLNPSSPFYNHTSAYHLIGSLNEVALEQSLNEIVRRHEVLRTTFRIVRDQPVQNIHASLDIKLSVVDLREISSESRKGKAIELVTEDLRRPFDLTRGPLLRATLVRLGKSEHVFFLTMHHIVVDGTSLSILLRELRSLYETFVGGAQPTLNELPIQYADFAFWERQRFTGNAESQLSYWRERLAGLPVLRLPNDRPRPHVQRFNGAREYFELPESLFDRLKALSREQDATLFMTLLAAFKVLLWRFSEQVDIAVGTSIANRNRKETKGLVGLFVNSLVLRTDLSGDPSFRDLLSRVRNAALGAYAHQDFPFEKLVEELRPQQDLSRHPLFQVMFKFQNASFYNASTESLKLPGLTASYLRADPRTSKLDLTLAMTVTRRGLGGKIEYDTDLYDAWTVARMLDYFQILLERIVANPEQRLSKLPPL